jgi:ribosomal protein L37AE/L43A
MTNALTLARKDMMIDPLQRVRVVVGPDGERVTLVFQCPTCDDGFDWMEADGWWACQTCGIELTPLEAEILLKAVERVVRKSISDVSTKRGLWDWVLWLLGRSRTGR